MADENLEDDLFADLYDDADVPTAAPVSAPAPQPVTAVQQETPAPDPIKPEASQNSEQNSDEQVVEIANQHMYDDVQDSKTSPDYGATEDNGHASHGYDDSNHQAKYNGAGSKEDGKMFIGGLSWETSDESLNEYFSQYGEVAECTVMRDPASGRSRGFGFLTFRDAKTVNSVMVKEHYLDGKIIDPKRAIPRDEQEKTSKIFVGGVSQEATEQDFREYFMQFGRVVDATLMIDKDTGRPRGFGFVTFDSEAAVDLCLSQPLEIHGKAIEVKKAQPRGNMRDDDDFNNRGNNQRGGFKQGGFQKRGQDDGNQNNGTGANQVAMPGNTPAGMSPQLMAQYWQKMQQYFAMMQQSMAMGGAGRGAGMPMAMNPAMMQQMQQMQAMQAMQGGAAGGMNPAMMQQMQQMQQMQNNMAGGGMGGSNNNPASNNPAFTPYEQQVFEQQKYDQQSNQRQQFQQGGNFNGNSNFGGGPSSWEGMYDDVPQPNIPGGGRGGFNNHKGGSQRGSVPPASAPAAPAGAPTGPKNAGRPGANYRGGGRASGGRGGFHPYARGGN